MSYEEGPSTATDDQAMVFKLRSSAIAPSGHILERERERLEKDLARANERARPQTDRREPVIAELLDSLRDVRRMLEAGSAEERKAVVRSFLHGIRIDKEKRQATLRWYRLPRDASVKLVAVGGIEPPTRGL